MKKVTEDYDLKLKEASTEKDKANTELDSLKERVASYEKAQADTEAQLK